MVKPAKCVVQSRPIHQQFSRTSRTRAPVMLQPSLGHVQLVLSSAAVEHSIDVLQEAQHLHQLRQPLLRPSRVIKRATSRMAQREARALRSVFFFTPPSTAYDTIVCARARRVNARTHRRQAAARARRSARYVGSNVGEDDDADQAEQTAGVGRRRRRVRRWRAVQQ
jgi:hypothetical protein